MGRLVASSTLLNEAGRYHSGQGCFSHRPRSRPHRQGPSLPKLSLTWPASIRTDHSRWAYSQSPICTSERTWRCTSSLQWTSCWWSHSALSRNRRPPGRPAAWHSWPKRRIGARAFASGRGYGDHTLPCCAWLPSATLRASHLLMQERAYCQRPLFVRVYSERRAHCPESDQKCIHQLLAALFAIVASFRRQVCHRCVSATFWSQAVIHPSLRRPTISSC